ncbi:hypothetical protein Tsubulata_039429 [Turnera subulata]|uniref:Uncharacterized protein n=1 Tax=Turnera subulata TaxID=218843 RepID=A0A9Q0G751_9ROSI|nr:hypothetical protein Tsubulata_039429 [Turnera subulata]
MRVLTRRSSRERDTIPANGGGLKRRWWRRVDLPAATSREEHDREEKWVGGGGGEAACSSVMVSRYNVEMEAANEAKIQAADQGHGGETPPQGAIRTTAMQWQGNGKEEKKNVKTEIVDIINEKQREAGEARENVKQKELSVEEEEVKLFRKEEELKFEYVVVDIKDPDGDFPAGSSPPPPITTDNTTATPKYVGLSYLGLPIAFSTAGVRMSFPPHSSLSSPHHALEIFFQGFIALALLCFFCCVVLHGVKKTAAKTLGYTGWAFLFLAYVLLAVMFHA